MNARQLQKLYPLRWVQSASLHICKPLNLRIMTIPIVTPITSLRSRASSDSLGYDFALLGLKVSESRVNVIRRAASRTAARIQQVTNNDSIEADQMLSDLATSTYRLLDPRRRMKPHERIQLSIIDDFDFELQKGSRTPLVNGLRQADFASATAS